MVTHRPRSDRTSRTTTRILVLLVTAFTFATGSNSLLAQKKDKRKPAKQSLRTIRVAVFELDILKGVDAESKAVTDQVVTMLSTMDKVTLVNREQLQKVADEQKIALSGLVDSSSAVKLGKFVSANYVVVGRASRIGQTYYLVLKFVNVETTVQTTIAVKAPVAKGFEGVLDRLAKGLTKKVRQLQAPQKNANDAVLASLRKIAKPLVGKVFLVSVEEQHINRPLKDPAAQLAVVQRLKALGLTVVSPKDPVDGWKRALLRNGRYEKRKIDFLIEGEGISAFAARLRGLTSCRARVELRIVPVPGREIAATDRGVAAGVDLVEALAAKTALEKAGEQAIDAVLKRLVKELNRGKAGGKKKRGR